jgi:integrase
MGHADVWATRSIVAIIWETTRRASSASCGRSSRTAGAARIGSPSCAIPTARIFALMVGCPGVPVWRTVPLLFATTRGNSFTDRTWSRESGEWRDAVGWPSKHGTFHALRHFFATSLIGADIEPKHVQWLLRHQTLRVTLETSSGGRSPKSAGNRRRGAGRGVRTRCLDQL